MFLETTREIYEKLAKKLSEKGISFEVSDCTMTSDGNTQHIHMEFGNLSNKTASLVAKLTDECCGLVAESSKQNKEENRPKAYAFDDMEIE